MIVEIILIVLGAPPAILGVMDLARRVNEERKDRGEKKKLQKNPLGDEGEQRFYVRSTYVKYIMGEDSSELTKVRVIRALQDVNKIRIDPVPSAGQEKDSLETEHAAVKQDFFSIPGVALRRGKYYQVDLADDQIFKAKADHSYIISFKLRQRLDVLHDNPKEDGLHIQKPLGTEEIVAEVHFPPTRKLKKVNNKAELKVYAVRGSDLEQIDSTKFTINAEDVIESIRGTFTDMFRLTLRDPPQDADLRIIWQWSVVG